MTNSSDYLAALPAVIADEVATLVRRITGMSFDEKAAALAITAEAMDVQGCAEVFHPGAELVAQLGHIIIVANSLATGQEG